MAHKICKKLKNILEDEDSKLLDKYRKVEYFRACEDAYIEDKEVRKDAKMFGGAVEEDDEGEHPMLTRIKGILRNIDVYGILAEENKILWYYEEEMKQYRDVKIDLSSAERIGFFKWRLQKKIEILKGTTTRVLVQGQFANHIVEWNKLFLK